MLKMTHGALQSWIARLFQPALTFLPFLTPLKHVAPCCSSHPPHPLPFGASTLPAPSARAPLGLCIQCPLPGWPSQAPLLKIPFLHLSFPSSCSLFLIVTLSKISYKYFLLLYIVCCLSSLPGGKFHMGWYFRLSLFGARCTPRIRRSDRHPREALIGASGLSIWHFQVLWMQNWCAGPC